MAKQGKKQKGPHWFLIKHECGAVFTINSVIFPQIDSEVLKCPNCQEELLIKENFRKLTRLLKEYEDISERLEAVNATIREIQLKDLEPFLEKGVG